MKHICTRNVGKINSSKGQSRKMSLTETLLNVMIGYIIAVTAQILVFPFFGVHIPLHDNLTIGLVFTVISIVRSYCLRRFFNWIHTKHLG